MTRGERADDLTEAVVFMVHGLKRLSFGFYRLDEVADAEDGSPMKAFYLDGVYNYLTAFFLLDRGNGSPGGTFQKVLAQFGLEHLLSNIRATLDARFGATTFGEVIRMFRNKHLVHGSHRSGDLDRIYAQVDMHDPQVIADYQARLESLRDTCSKLAHDLANSAGIKPRDLGLR